MVNFYEVLGISRHASTEEVIKAYKAKAKIHHPDKNNGSDSSKEMFNWITLAKNVLIDPDKRLEHDYAVGVKQRPAQQRRIIQNQEKDYRELIGWGLLAFIAGLALGGNSDS